MSQFIDRMIRAAKLDAQVYEEVEADKSAMPQAIGVVVLSSVAGGIGFMQNTGLTGLLFGAVLSLIGWYIWAFVTYLIGTKLLPEPQTSADVGELLRTIGFSSAPGLIRVFALIPGLDMTVNLLATICHGSGRAPSLGLSQHLPSHWGVSAWMDCASRDYHGDCGNGGWVP